MQSLIELIAEKVIAEIGIPPVYVWRGEQNDCDWDQTTLILDSAFHELDLGGIIPAGASAVNMFARVKNPTVGFNVKFQMKKQGAIHTQYTCILRPQVADIWIGGLYPIKLSDDRKIEYNARSLTLCEVKLVIRGWWL